MDETWNSFSLCIAQHRKAGITANSDNCIGLKIFNYPSYLEKTHDQLEGQCKIFNQRTSVKTCYINSSYLISCLRHFFHFHFSLCPNKQELNRLIFFFQGICNCNRRKNMSTCSTTCKYYFNFTVFHLPSFDRFGVAFNTTLCLAFCLLPFAFCPLPIAYCLLPFASLVPHSLQHSK